HLAAELVRTGKSLKELASVMTVYPQTMVNVKDVDHESLGDDDAIAAAVVVAQEKLGNRGRVLLRPSGTEPLVRVMVEASDQELADEIANSLASVVRKRLSR
ncbi:MAG: phosphoglucosamine mutase, partial [Cryobacterium sp.]|nr:phosphoglucosamine mutase [Cryobacterium sp.]